MIYFPGLKVSSAKQQCKLLLPHSCCPEQGSEGGEKIRDGGREAETEREGETKKGEEGEREERRGREKEGEEKERKKGERV